ncbi:hypothetical protein Tco_0013802 [Tanacetum coccineum]
MIYDIPQGSIARSSGGSMAKHSMESKEGLGSGGFVVLGGRSSSVSKKCLDGWVGASRGEVKGGGVDFGVSRTLLGEILGEIIGEVAVKYLGLMDEPFDNW